LATAALRGLLVVAALALGFFVLSKAFPSGGESPATPTGADPTTLAPVSPSPVDSPTREVPEPLDPSEVEIQVLNGTEVSGLASDTADTLEAAGYQISTVGDAETAYDTTTIFHLRKRKADAQVLQQAFFPSAVLEIAEEDTKVDMTVILGSDYAESSGTGESPAETPTETPT
jgi:hypothetical protein